MRKSVCVLAVLLVLAAACGKSVDSEKRSWESNLKTLSELSLEYPAFAELIKARIAAAEPVMQEAGSIADEEAKIKKMSEANEMLRPVFVRNLGEFRELKGKIRTKVIDAKALKAEANEMTAVNQAAYDADRALREGEYKLKAVIGSEREGDALSGLVLTEVRNAESNLDRIMGTIKGRQAAEKKVADDKIKQDQQAEKQKEEASKPIECEYCGAMNPPDAVTCKGCGAGLKKK